MSPRLEVRSVDAYRRPEYPGFAAPVAFASARYGESALERMRRGLTRPLVVFGLYATLQLGAAADDEPPPLPIAREGRADPGPEVSEVRTLGRAEIESLVCGLEALVPEVAIPVDGGIGRGTMGFLTEEEGRALLEAFFAKNGFTVDRDVSVQLPGLEFTADGFDPDSGIGFEYLGPDGIDPTPGAIRDLELERTRRGRAILVLDSRNYAYDHPAKAEAVDRLLEDVRRFFLWLREDLR